MVKAKAKDANTRIVNILGDERIVIDSTVREYSEYAFNKYKSALQKVTEPKQSKTEIIETPEEIN